MTTYDDPDLDLLQAMSNGDSTALTELYERHKPKMLNFLIMELDDSQLAEEVLQDVMIAVWKQASKFRAESQVQTWMYTIARRQAYHARQRMIKHQHHQLEDATVIANDRTESRLENLDNQETLKTLIQYLPPNQQQAIIMVFSDGMKVTEAAKELGIPLSTMKSRLFRARNTLRQLLTTLEDSDDS